MRFFKFEQIADQPREDDVAAATRRELDSLRIGDLSGKRVALTGGSRGIPNIVLILSTIVAYLREKGAEPFVVPTMGSHGGGTAEGQVKYLAGYGITEESLGCPIIGDMSTTVVDVIEGSEIHFSDSLLNADAMLVINRIKAHTGFVSEVESGLCKMLAIGGGRYAGAQSIHARSENVGMGKAVLDAARRLLEKLIEAEKLLGGIALIDNADKQTARVQAVTPTSPDAFIEQEKELLQYSLTLLMQLPFEVVDVCLFDRMGKNVSGTGLDTNVVCKRREGWRIRELPRPGQASIAVLCCRCLSPESKGNAIGLGLLDLVTQQLIDDIDWHPTRTNAETAGALNLIAQPEVCENDERMLERAVSMVPERDGGAVVVIAKDTGQLRTLYASENMLEVVRAREDLRLLSEAADACFIDGEIQLQW